MKWSLPWSRLSFATCCPTLPLYFLLSLLAPFSERETITSFPNNDSQGSCWFSPLKWDRDLVDFDTRYTYSLACIVRVMRSWICLYFPCPIKGHKVTRRVSKPESEGPLRYGARNRRNEENESRSPFFGIILFPFPVSLAPFPVLGHLMKNWPGRLSYFRSRKITEKKTWCTIPQFEGKLSNNKTVFDVRFLWFIMLCQKAGRRATSQSKIWNLKTLNRQFSRQIRLLGTANSYPNTKSILSFSLGF